MDLKEEFELAKNKQAVKVGGTEFRSDGVKEFEWVNQNAGNAVKAIVDEINQDADIRTTIKPVTQNEETYYAYNYDSKAQFGFEFTLHSLSEKKEIGSAVLYLACNVPSYAQVGDVHLNLNTESGRHKAVLQIVQEAGKKIGYEEGRQAKKAKAQSYVDAANKWLNTI